MKKISTVAAQKIEKVEGQRLTVGLDLRLRQLRNCRYALPLTFPLIGSASASV